ncbi:hypothetical protein [Streptomyces platensis]
MNVTRTLRAVGGAMVVGALLFGTAPVAAADQIRHDQWTLRSFGANDVGKVSTGKGVTVAVIDDPVDGGHPVVNTSFEFHSQTSPAEKAAVAAPRKHDVPVKSRGTAQEFHGNKVAILSTAGGVVVLLSVILVVVLVAVQKKRRNGPPPGGFGGYGGPGGPGVPGGFVPQPPGPYQQHPSAPGTYPPGPYQQPGTPGTYPPGPHQQQPGTPDTYLPGPYQQQPGAPASFPPPPPAPPSGQ